jgi:predicted HicB family RNase H-like nuclease
VIADFIREKKGNVGFYHLNPTYRSAIALLKNILDRAISITRSPLVAKSCQTKAQAGHKAEESYSNPCQESSAPNYSPYQQAVSARNRYPQNHQH